MNDYDACYHATGGRGHPVAEYEHRIEQAHSSMSRAIYPFHTLLDGDTLFAVSTNEVANPSLEVAALGVPIVGILDCLEVRLQRR